MTTFAASMTSRTPCSGITGSRHSFSSIPPPWRGKAERLEVYRYFRSTRFGQIGEFYDSFYRALDQAPGGKKAKAVLDKADASGYLADKPFYSLADRTFRYLRDRVLGTDGYHRVMDRMIEENGMDTDALIQTLWMDASCLRRLQSEDNVIGLHSHSHPTRISALPEAEQVREYRENLSALEGILGAPPTTVSHPCGDYDAKTLEVLKSLGVKIGFRAEMDSVLKSPLEYPRENHALTLMRMRA